MPVCDKLPLPTMARNLRGFEFKRAKTGTATALSSLLALLCVLWRLLGSATHRNEQGAAIDELVWAQIELRVAIGTSRLTLSTLHDFQ